MSSILSLQPQKRKWLQLHWRLIILIALIALFSFQIGLLISHRPVNEPLKLQQATAEELFNSSPGSTTNTTTTKTIESVQINRKGNDVRTHTITTSTPAPFFTKVVASKAAKSKLYHYPWCSGAKRIKPENLIEFPSEQDAIIMGYKLAKNCRK